LARDNKHAVEKEQAIKLIRAIVEIGSEKRGAHTAPGVGSVPLSEAVMRAVIAVAEHPEDPFKGICILTLTEIRKSWSRGLASVISDDTSCSAS
jgi:rapamycin-insensitive companion of mTOR